MSPKQEMCLPRKSVLRNCMEICAVCAVAPSCWKHNKSCWQGCNSMRSKVSSMTIYHSAFTVIVHPSAFSKQKGPIMPREGTACHTCHWCTMQKMLVKFMWIVWASSDNSNVFTMSLMFFKKSYNSLQNCSRLTLSLSLSSWATWILYGW